MGGQPRPDSRDTCGSVSTAAREGTSYSSRARDLTQAISSPGLKRPGEFILLNSSLTICEKDVGEYVADTLADFLDTESKR
jgi:hypothetical protein